MDQAGQFYGSAKSHVSSNSGAAVIVIVLLGLACLYLAYTHGYIPGVGGAAKSSMTINSHSAGAHSALQTLVAGGNMGPGVTSGSGGVALSQSHPANQGSKASSAATAMDDLYGGGLGGNASGGDGPSSSGGVDVLDLQLGGNFAQNAQPQGLQSSQALTEESLGAQLYTQQQGGGCSLQGDSNYNGSVGGL